MSKPLTIYKASAGSGKTFTLATEYIKLVVRNPQAYRQILAVTFTNKATEEMKMRILSQLYGIWRKLPDSKKYATKIEKELDASPEWVAQQAGIALTNLLHNYSYFRVETIDSFFQSVLRNLARELELTANLRVGLNDGQVEEMAVDQLIENLTTQDLMLKWLMKYIMETIDDDRSWNVIGQIKKFGKTIFRDYFKAHSKELYKAIEQPDFLEHYAATLRDIREKSKKQMKDIADEFFKVLKTEGIDISELSYGCSGVASIFIKMQNGQLDESIVSKRVNDCKDQPEKWCKKTSEKRELIMQLASGELGQLLNKAIDIRPDCWHLYKSADLTLAHLNQLRLLDSIERKVRELNITANRFLLSDTQQLLHDLIEGSDSPFIFEKIGTQLKHIMIDEFQDTSTVQWQNFKILLQELMSHEDTENLIVGDVKQSIYRWRGGDWRLLHHIKQEFPHSEEMIGICNLDTNYRSLRNIVAFNNAFFEKAAQLEGVDAYDDVKQEVPADKGREGEISITLLPSEDYQQRTLEALVEHVRRLMDAQIPVEKMAILVRANTQIPIIANYFMEQLPQVKIVSDEAFRLDASPAVNIIIQAMINLTNPNNVIAKAALAKAYSHKALHEGVMEEMLPEAYINHMNELARLPLYELAERLYTLFRLEQMSGQSAYLCAFYDQVATFSSEQSADLAGFLKEWDKNICSKSIQSPVIDGIRLITIHKSKGLEFDHVMVPFCDWTMEHGDTLWCQPQEEPFSQLPMVPIRFSQTGMTGTIYQSDYEQEHKQNQVDNLNILYVAFTRASRSLMVLGRRDSKSSRSRLIENTLPEIVKDLEGATIEGENDQNAPLHFKMGVLPPYIYKEVEKEEDSNVLLQPEKALAVNIESYDSKAQFVQSNRSQDFATSEDDDEQLTRQRYIQMGTILHEVFSTIRTRNDIEAALSRMEFEGILYDQSLTKERIGKMIRKRLEDPRVALWFEPGRWKLFNECAILSVDAEGHLENRRPDRVMTDGQQTIVVDFKFGHPNDDYLKQVREYTDLLRRMGHLNVKGYLWFVYTNKIVDVV